MPRTAVSEATNSHFTNIDWIVLVVYFAGTMAIGFYFWRRSRSTEGFTAAGRSLPGWVCGLSIFATYLSSISYLALPGKSFVTNWNPFVFSLSIPIATWIAVRWFLPYYRASGEVSAYALLEHRFGVWARIYASVFYLLTQIAHMGVVMYLMALPLAVIFGWDIRLIILVTGISVTIYSFVGGLIAVIWADAIQAIVLMAGAVICLAVLLVTAEGGAAHVITTAAAAGKFSLGAVRSGQRSGRPLVRRHFGHIPGRAPLRDIHQLAEFRHRSKLYPALYRFEQRRRSAQEPLAGWHSVRPGLGRLLPDRHVVVRFLPCPRRSAGSL